MTLPEWLMTCHNAEGTVLFSRGQKGAKNRVKLTPCLISGYPLILRGYGETWPFGDSSKTRICNPTEGHSNPNKAIEYNSLHGKSRKMARRLRSHSSENLASGGEGRPIPAAIGSILAN